MSQENLDFIIDSPDANKKFIDELSLRMRRLRFGEISTKKIAQNWVPEHTLIVCNHKGMVALADIIRTPDSRVGNFSIVAKEDCGVYAFIALFQLNRLYPVEMIETTFSEPTEFLISLAKRWADVIYDQETWANARELTMRFDAGTTLAPTPIALTKKNLEFFKIPEPHLLDSTSRQQIAYCCLNENDFYLAIRDYGPIPKSVTTALGFEITKLELTKRQKVTRSILIGVAQKLGFVLDKSVITKNNYSNARNLFLHRLSEINSSADITLNGPVFKIISNKHEHFY